MSEELLESRVRDLEKTVTKHGNFVWVVLTVAVIFGISGGIGFKILTGIKEELDKSTAKVVALQDQLSKTQETIDKYVEKKQEELTETLTTKTNETNENLSKVLDASLESFDNHIRQTTEEYDLSAISERLTNLERYREDMTDRLASFKIVSTDELWIRGDGELEAVRIYKDKNGSGRVSISNKEGYTIARLSGDDDGDGYIRLNNFSGNKIASIHKSSNTRSGYLTLSRSGNESLIELGASTNGNSAIFLHNGDKYKSLTYSKLIEFDTFDNFLRELKKQYGVK